MKKINSIEELKKESASHGADFFVSLNGGFRSSKHIWYDEDANHFEIINYIDDSEQVLTEEQLMDNRYTNIGEAISLSALYKD